MSAAYICLEQLCVRRRGRVLLAVEKLEIPAGQFITVLGPNGAGKTTLLKLCCGLIKPSAGRVHVAGSDLRALSSWARTNLRRRFGYIPQATFYHAELPFTVREIVAMGRTSRRGLLRRLTARDYELVDEWIDRLGLADKRHQSFRSLSGGEQQKALIARAMAQQPELLMLDEPCSNLDFAWKRRIAELIGRLYEQNGLTVLMVTHETSVLPSQCRRVILLDRGRVKADGPLEQVTASRPFKLAYGLQVEQGGQPGSAAQGGSEGF